MDQLHARAKPGLTRRLYESLRAQIADGTLRAGAVVPSTRALAAEWGVSRTTVTTVYEQLAAEGFLLTSVGRASRVAPALDSATRSPGRAAQAHAGVPTLSAFGRRVAAIDMPSAVVSTPARHDFLYGAVAPTDFPMQAWRRAYQAELQREQAMLYYVAPEGDPGLRRAVQGYLRRARGLVCDAEQIVVVHGTQQGIDLCARLLLDAGDALVMEDPGYLIVRRSFEAYGAQVLPVPVDAQGLDPEHLPTQAGVRLAYVTPSHQFPLGGVLPVGRRQALLQWARQRDAWILEDDYDGEFRYGQRPIEALQSIDTDGRVIYLGTFSKSLSPQLRLGYLVLPPALVPAFAQAKRLADRHAPLLEQRTLAALIDAGLYERHVRRMRRTHERRRSALLAAIARHLPAQAQVAGTAAGLHVVLWLPWLPAHAEPTLVTAARRADVGVYPISPLFAQPATRWAPRAAGLVLGYASLPPAQIDQGIARLAQVLDAFETQQA